MNRYFKYFGISATLSLLTTVAVVYYLGLKALLPLVILAVIEVTFSFDNAVVNAKILKRLSNLWQQLFLSIGIIIAIFGVRLLLPILIVAMTADLSLNQVLDLALHNPEEYAEKLEIAHPTITAFGGAFLLMLSLHFFIEEDKKHHWIEWLERPMNKLGAWWTPLAMTGFVLVVLALLPANHHPWETLRAGALGIATYLAIQGVMWGINRMTKNTGKQLHYVGWAAFIMFMYLQVLDASFSLDGVLGAFAITSDVILIAAGLGIGAFWVRSMTVYLVRRGTLDSYRFLEHGAHYAILVLAGAMLLSAIYELPEALTGILGLMFIAGAIYASTRHRRKSL